MCSQITEGKAVIETKSADVFYNPVQQFNRDLTVAVLRTFVEDLYGGCESSASPQKKQRLQRPSHAESGISILDALSATGLRSIRFAKEVPHVRQIVANDLSSHAVQFIKRNVASNGVEELVLPVNEEATSFMYRHRGIKQRFDVVDLDPYGSAARFLDAAVQCVSDNGLLMVTCTDVAVLCGNTPEACFAKYGSMSLKCKCCHEVALRILISCIDSHANCYGRFVEPLLSVSADFYVRVFLLIRTGPAIAKRSACKRSLIYQCASCESFVLQPLARQVGTPGKLKFANAAGPPVPETCNHCGGHFRIAGPLWSAPIQDVQFVERIINQVESMKGTDMQLATTARLIGLMKLITEELVDVPLYYHSARLSSILHLPTPKQSVLWSALLNGKYRVSASHACPSAVKTDAPNEFIWDIMRSWAKQCTPDSISLIDHPSHSVANRILSVPPRNLVDFQEHPLCEPTSKREGCLRYPMNPEKHWGPRAKARISHRDAS
uniref:tRNA (guanine(26)-N(2))-dimethyltransferase n=1 Tax=Trichuris muris TaxID=70415 RepID=A0A5S6QQJ9_TRIMR